MKNSLIAAGIVALLASTGANAADIVTYQEHIVTAAPAAVDWNGAYIGGTIGGSWAKSKTRLGARSDGGNHYTRLAKKGVDPESFVGGLYAGYNFQPAFLSSSAFKNVVFGVETDFLFNSGDDSGKKNFSAVDLPFTYKASVKQKWNGSTRLRAGYALGSEGRFLPYIAAGVSYADIQGRAGVAADKNAKNGFDRLSKTKTRAGWNAGVGVDYVPSIVNDHIVLRAEYRYTDFGKESSKWNVSDEDGAVGSVKQRVKFQQNDFRVGVAYKF